MVTLTTPEVSLHTRTALVSGGTRGIGKEISMCLAQAGARVYALYKEDDQSAQSCRDEAAQYGLAILPRKCDITSASDVDRLCEELIRSGDTVLIIVNNAKVEFRRATAVELESSDLQAQFEISVLGPLNLAKHFVPQMREAKWGRIINIGSTAVETYPVGYASYVVGKMGLCGLTTAMATELGQDQITVNNIMAGRVAGHGSERRSAWVDQVAPLRRRVTARDIGQAVLFFASDLAQSVTGATLVVDAGLLRREVISEASP